MGSEDKLKRGSSFISGRVAVEESRHGGADIPEVGQKLHEPSSSWLEKNKLSRALEERHSLLAQPRVEKDTVLCVGEWDMKTNRVVVTKKKGKELERFGHHDSLCGAYLLNPEEALFLLESNSLIILHGGVEMSVEIGYALLLAGEGGCTLSQYRVFSHLSRLGFKLIRHKKPAQPVRKVNQQKQQQDRVKKPLGETSQSVNNQNRASTKNQGNISKEVVVIDLSSDSDNEDDVVILDVKRNSRGEEIIDLDDDDSQDSDIVIIEEPGLVEVPLPDWPYIHRKKFLSPRSDDIDNVNHIQRLDPLIISQPEYEIFNDIPNIMSQRRWLYRQEDFLYPHGVWPFHFKYLVDLNENRTGRFNFRRGFRGNMRGREMFLQRQVNQMKNYTLSLMNMVSQMMGGQAVEGFQAPPPGLFRGMGPRGPNRGHSSGRISFGCRGSSFHAFNQRVKTENYDEDVKPKRIKLEYDETDHPDYYVPNQLQNTDIHRDIKGEPSDTKPDITALQNICVKSEASVKKETVYVDSSSNASEISNSNSDTATGMITVANIAVPPVSSSPTPISQNIEASEKTITATNGEIAPANISVLSDQNPTTNEAISSSEACTVDESKLLDESKTAQHIKNNEISSPEATFSNLPTADESQHSDVSKSGKQIEHDVENVSSQAISNNSEDESRHCDDSKTPKQLVNNEASAGPCQSSQVEMEIDTPVITEENVFGHSLDGSTECDDAESNKGNNQTVDPLGSLDNNQIATPSQSFVDKSGPHSRPDTCSQAHSVEMNKPKQQVLPTECIDISEESCEELSSASVTAEDSQPPEAYNRDSDKVLNLHDADKPTVNGVKTDTPCEKNMVGWKELKKGDCSSYANTTLNSEVDVERISDCEGETLSGKFCNISPLIESHHCASLDNVLARLRIFKEYTGGDVISEAEVTVQYDLYLPTTTYYRKLPPDPDLRLIILRPEDTLPAADEMIYLRRLYSDNKGFLFASVLPDSVAYYLYDSVCLPIDADNLVNINVNLH